MFGTPKALACLFAIACLLVTLGNPTARADSTNVVKGNLGIVTSSPGELNSSADDLVIGAGDETTDHGLTIYTHDNKTGSIFFADGISGSAEYAGYIQYYHNGNYMVFGTDGDDDNPRMRISSDGKVGIGNTAPDQLLCVGMDDGTDDVVKIGAATITWDEGSPGELDLSGNVTVAADLLVGDDLVVTDDLTANDLDVAGNVVVDGELLIGQRIKFDPYPYSEMTITFKPAGEPGPPANLTYEDVSGDFQFTFDVQAPSFIETSSRDLKTSITEISTAQAWSDLDDLTPVSYVFRQDVAPDGSVPPDQHYRGFIAEDLPKSLKLTRPVVRLSHIISCNTAALKEAKAVILDQEGRIRALEADVTALKAALGGVVMSAPVAEGQ